MSEGAPYSNSLVEYVRELADEFGQRLGAVALCGPDTILVLIDGHGAGRRRAYRDGRQFDVHIRVLADARADVVAGDLPIANSEIAQAVSIYDPRALLPDLRETAASRNRARLP